MRATQACLTRIADLGAAEYPLRATVILAVGSPSCSTGPRAATGGPPDRLEEADNRPRARVAEPIARQKYRLTARRPRDSRSTCCPDCSFRGRSIPVALARLPSAQSHLRRPVPRRKVSSGCGLSTAGPRRSRTTAAAACSAGTAAATPSNVRERPTPTSDPSSA